MITDVRAAPGVASGAAAIVALGVVLGLAYNALGHQARRPWGLPWLGQDRVAALATVTASAADDGYVTDVDDPRAVFGGVAGRLPEIPALGRPVQIDIAALRQYVDAGAALLLDAREPDEFAAGRIPGSVNVPYERAISDPALLESLDDRGRPLITYCGGGQCELSLSLAEELIFAGFERVAVYIGGYPEWEEAGYPVERGRAGGQR